MILNFSPVGWDKNIQKILDAIPEDDDVGITLPNEARKMFLDALLENDIEKMNAIRRACSKWTKTY